MHTNNTDVPSASRTPRLAVPLSFLSALEQARHAYDAACSRALRDVVAKTRECETLQAVIDVAWALLTPAARDLFMSDPRVVRMLQAADKPVQEAPTLSSKLFVLTLVDKDNNLFRVAVRSHSHDGARTRLWGSDWGRGWIAQHGNSLVRDMWETEMTNTQMVAQGVTPVLVDEEVVKIHTLVREPPATTSEEASEEHLRLAQSATGFAEDAEAAATATVAKLFVVHLKHDKGGRVRVAVKAHGIDGARTVLRGSAWWKDWLEHNGNPVERGVLESDMTPQQLAEGGVEFAYDVGEVAKTENPIFGYARPPKSVDPRPWYAMVALTGPRDNRATEVTRCQAATPQDAAAELPTLRLNSERPQVLAILTSTSEIVALEVRPPEAP